MALAKVFKSGNSQAIRLPREFRLNVSEVELIRSGDDIVIRQPHATDLVTAFEALASMPEDFFPEGRIDLPLQPREEL